MSLRLVKPEPDQDTILTLRHFLKLAEAGELRGVAIFAERQDQTHDWAQTGVITAATLVYALDRMKYNFHKTLEAVEGPARG